jgi:hypothetical protein
MSPECAYGPELVPGTLILLVLRVLDSGPLHGFAIAQRISQVSGEAFRVEEGSLYPRCRRCSGRAGCGLIGNCPTATVA